MENNKVSIENEDPVNIVLIYLCLALSPIFKFFINLFFIPTQAGPNILTATSLIIALYGLFKIYNEQYFIGSILFFTAYIFDVWDGLFARKYKAITKFGDYFDHIGDGIKITGLLLIILFSNNITRWNKFIFVIVFITLGMLTLWHIGCQQKKYKDRTHHEMLDGLKGLCKYESHIKYSKFFGTGIIILLMSIFIASLEFIN